LLQVDIKAKVRRESMNRFFSKIVLLGFLSVYGVALVYTAQGRGQSGSDFATYYITAQALRRGENIYTLSDVRWSALANEYHIERFERPYLYPPLLAGGIALLGSLSPRVALVLWNSLNVLALTITGVALSQLVRQTWIDPIVFFALTCYVPNLTSLYAGQANHLVLLSVALYLLFAQQKRPYAAGLGWAAGIALKPIAAPLGIHLIWRRDTQVIALMVGLIVLIVITVLLAGPQASWDYVQNFWQTTPLSVGASPVAYPPNQSVFGFFGRLLTAHEYGHSLVNSPALARAFSFGTIGLLLVGVALLTWPQTRNWNETFILETGLVLITINLIVPISWYHHLVISIISLVVAWYTSSTRAARAALIVAFALIGVQGAWHAFEGHTLLLSLGTYGLTIVYIVLALRLIQIRRASPILKEAA